MRLQGDSLEFKCSSPTRVDLAGGTLDLWPLYSFLGGATTVNLAISISTHAHLKLNASSTEIVISSKELKKEWKFSNLEELLSTEVPVWDRAHSLRLFSYFFRNLRSVTAGSQDFFKKFGFYLHTSSESPVGGGLGGSSSLMISLTQVFKQALESQGFKVESLSSIHQMVHFCHNVEAQVLLTPTGTQDYYPAVAGGCLSIHYGPDSIGLKSLSLPDWFFKQAVLVYTGQSHHSGINNFEVLKKAVAGQKDTLTALKNLLVTSQAMLSWLVSSSLKYEDLIPILRDEYKQRVELEPTFSSDSIRDIFTLMQSAGGDAVKICGAGGGGCVLVFFPESRGPAVKEVLTQKNYKILPFEMAANRAVF